MNSILLKIVYYIVLRGLFKFNLSKLLLNTFV